VFAEWRTARGHLAGRRGVDGDAVTGSGDGHHEHRRSGNDRRCCRADRHLDAYTGSNGCERDTYSEVLIAINPIWAEMIAREYSDAEDVQSAIWRFARRPMSAWPETYHRWFIEGGRVGDDGMVPLVPTPDQVLLTVAGGLGGLHAAALHGWGEPAATCHHLRPTSV
jgi:hypothetical protein